MGYKDCFASLQYVTRGYVETLDIAGTTTLNVYKRNMTVDWIHLAQDKDQS
jgi:hypothetical protein